MSKRRKKGPLRRLWACGKVRRIARRAGRLDARSELQDTTVAALRKARCAALSIGALLDDVNDATIEGLDQGRTLAAAVQEK